MNGRTVIIGLVMAAAALAALNTFWQRPQTSPRRDPLASSSNGTDGVLLPRVRPAPGERQPTEPTPRKRAATSIQQGPLPADAAPADAAGSSQPAAKEKSLERYALAYVGADSLAEAIWLDAINDPTVPAQERADLIEDLNEEGFADPKHLTPDDLPLIVSRLALIEREGPLAMDETNAAAFAEAYKDLVNMYERTSASAAAAAASAAEAAAVAEAAAAAAAAEAAAAESQATQLEPPVDSAPEPD